MTPIPPKRWFIAIVVQDHFDLIPAPDGSGILARTSEAIWPLLFHSAHDALAYGRKHNVGRSGWLPDGRAIVNWRVACTKAVEAEKVS